VGRADTVVEPQDNEPRHPPTLRSDPMKRPAPHAATRPFRVLRAAVDAHRQHGSTPHLGCAVCARWTVMRPIKPRWAAPTVRSASSAS